MRINKDMVFTTAGGCVLPLVSNRAESDTLYVTIRSIPDNLNRQFFTCQWMTDNVGKECNETGLRGQNFFTELELCLKEFTNKGYKIEYRYELLDLPITPIYIQQ